MDKLILRLMEHLQQLIARLYSKNMDRVLFATTNTQKVNRLRRLTRIQLYSLSDLPYKIEAPKEEGKDALDIAILKARYYWDKLKEKVPVLTQDDTLKMKVDPEDDPNTFIKQPVIDKYGTFTDAYAIEYYTNLAQKYGGEIPMYFEYGHALCSSDGEEIIIARKSRLYGKIVTEPKENDSTKGYFLSAIMKVKIDDKWKYYSELTDGELVQVDKSIEESLKRILN